MITSLHCFCVYCLLVYVYIFFKEDPFGKTYSYIFFKEYPFLCFPQRPFFNLLKHFLQGRLFLFFFIIHCWLAMDGHNLDEFPPLALLIYPFFLLSVILWIPSLNDLFCASLSPFCLYSFVTMPSTWWLSLQYILLLSPWTKLGYDLTLPFLNVCIS